MPVAYSGDRDWTPLIIFYSVLTTVMYLHFENMHRVIILIWVKQDRHWKKC